MKILENGFPFGGGIVAAGALGMLFTPRVARLAAGVVWPLARGLLKGGIKGGILAYEGVRVAIAGTRDTIEGLTAEASSELGEDAGVGEPHPAARAMKPASQKAVAPKRARRADLRKDGGRGARPAARAMESPPKKTGTPKRARNAAAGPKSRKRRT